MTGANSLTLSGELIEREALRFTPAGVAVLAAKLAHRSSQREAGFEREVGLEVSLVFADDQARRAEALALGATLELEGFLAPRRLNSPVMVMHVRHFRVLTN
ncbi:MAG: primosomal replication protein N [Burkholderiaceae bacterium]